MREIFILWFTVILVFSLFLSVFSNSINFNVSGCKVFVLTKTIPIGSMNILSKIDSNSTNIEIKLISKSQFFDIGLIYLSNCSLMTKKLFQDKLQKTYLNYSSGIFYKNYSSNVYFNIKEEMLFLIISPNSSININGYFQISIEYNIFLISAEIIIIIAIIGAVSVPIILYIVKKKEYIYDTIVYPSQDEIEKRFPYLIESLED